MTVAVHRTVFCDGCGAWHEYLDARTAAAARRSAVKAGWKCRDGKDLCRACAKKEDEGGRDDHRMG